mmetsp:Transcript_25707/g.64815  ORF Transcript_25707/g.64815 Transcript_25707/m.64815 type:complete len:240 (+) Transcript_25707:527-1246(+)
MHPSEGNLRGRASLLRRHVHDALDRSRVLVKVLPGEPRQHGAEVTLANVGSLLEGLREEPPVEGRVGHDANAELARCGDDLLLKVPCLQGPLHLHSGDWHHGVRPAKLGGGAFAQSDVFDLARFLQFEERSHRLLDGSVGVHPVHVVKVDAFDAQPVQALLALLLDRLGLAADAHALRPDLEAELCRDDELVPPQLLERLAHEDLIVSVHVRGVEHVGAELEGLGDGGDGLLLALLGGH